ncbi:Protein MKS1 [Forsythia ovata]|uniref:Protein MKS1 n=1 Tax=Forsythia ovata TaxID=205694 RepID=A0ABD1WPE8_9LAMI
MDFPEPFSGASGGNKPSPRKELQGPRPAALKVNKDSHKIRKPPLHHQAPPVAPPPPQQVEERQPVIIYAVSPKVHHTTVGDFMDLVQRLTGNNTTTFTGGGGGAGDLSPAARLASIEKTSPSERQKEREFTVDNIMDILEDTNLEVGQIPGILSPAPATLPPISPGFFSPAPMDPFMLGYNMFIPSPSTLFSVPMVPSPSSSFDLFNPLFDF